MLLTQDIKANMADMGFKEVTKPFSKHGECILLLKKQTFSINRAVVIVKFSELPDDLECYLKILRKNVAFKIGFFPLFYGVGLQVIIIANNIDLDKIDTTKLVSKIDNQWSIVQSVYMLNTAKKSYHAIRTWGQFITGKYQSKISEIIETEYVKMDA